jgi:mono/diheme cytochrome c family protein
MLLRMQRASFSKHSFMLCPIMSNISGLRLIVTVACGLCFVSAGWSRCTAAEPKRTLSPDHAQQMKQGMDLFKQHVRSDLIKHCVECHGRRKPKGEFDLSTRSALVDSGYIEVGKAKESFLYKLITHEEEPHMPHKADKLPAETIARIARWIGLGAPYDKPLVEKAGVRTASNGEITDADRRFWSFQPLMVVSPPPVYNSGWVRTPVDWFVLRKLQQRKLTPNAAADRHTLIRRAYFDLIGLPPKPAEVDAFVKNPDPKAYDKLIDRLLDSPQFGERWARHWMDVARFAESHGYEQDYDRPNAYPYRDFLIKALNADMPFDQFVRWQLAGDELAADDPLAMSATGFLGAGAFPTQLTEMEFESARYDELDDMTNTIGTAILGLTVGCARCHDHKYDPISTTNYYRFVSTFTTTIRSEIDLDLGYGKKPSKVMVTSEGFPHMKHHADGRGFPHFYKQTYVLERGDVRQKKEVATQSFLRVLMRNGKDTAYWKVERPKGWTRTSFRRASMANWITDSQHGAGHLMARVIVNRLWQHHFGRGIVATPNDFGFQGERPTHPELLDWLATDLIHNGWKLKRLHKLLMTSAVYRQNSKTDDFRARIDRENVYLWRRAPRRLEAEAIRDAMLSVAGMLDKTMYGPGTLDQNMRRRSVYFFIKRSKLIPMMMLFDWPEHLVSIGSRSSTTIAPQALMHMNSPQGRSFAEGLAKRLQGKTTHDAIGGGYQLAVSRAPTEKELKLTVEFIAQQTDRYRQAKKQNPEHLALIDFCQILLSMNEFVYVE